MHKIINGCIEILEQSEAFLLSSTPDSYLAITKPYFISSCGEHMRHVLDHFNAILSDYHSGVINYDRRQRGSDIEKNIHRGQQEITRIKTWLLSLDDETLDKALTVQTEVSVSAQNIIHTHSCLGRELVFASAHAIHHFSMMSIAMQMQDLQADSSFGIAPATQTHLRSEQCAP
ncbi:hypothetical protein MNBD_GAMMA11-2678 [hydrothermal vent metagenome]|uniref:DinB-like domain-containing protein n=1 Tax=hydrothermal vent metagenome TaxID=652676 RepID=A0A3B0X372_9ZZZZ